MSKFDRDDRPNTRFKCVVCGKLTMGRIPRKAEGIHPDLSFRYPRWHLRTDGQPCDGNYQEAEWVDIPPNRCGKGQSG